MTAFVLGLLTSLGAEGAQTDFAALEQGFYNPPDVARPRVWWHWMNGNVTQEGIKLDLEWMHRIGIGGLQNFDAALNTPKLVDERLVFMTPRWQEAFRYTTNLADLLGLELAVAGSPGWSESGGPWVKPQDGMKKLVWAETEVVGGRPLVGKLPHPPTVIGPFQNVPIDRSGMANPATGQSMQEVYADVAVMAYRLPAAERSMAELRPVVTSSAGSVDAHRLWDGDLTHLIHLPYGHDGNPAWIVLDFGRAQKVHSMSLGLNQTGWDLWALRRVAAQLQASPDGITYRTIATAYDGADESPTVDPPLQETVTFPPVTARYFRLQLPTPTYPNISPTVADWWWIGRKPTEHQVTQFVLHTTPRVDHFEQKAGYFIDAGLKDHATPHSAPTDILSQRDVIDLTARLQPDGTLHWTPPAGRWAILRVGYSLLGITNHPASPEGTGLEADKLDRAAVKNHMNRYLGLYESMLRPTLIGSHGLRAMVNDSWEAGAQNWTAGLPGEFARRRGYDLIAWLPALTGRIVGSAEESDRFLWDFRRTLGELLTENHYGQLAESLRARNMVHYGEAHEVYRAFIGDGMDVKRDDDVPMAAMWVPGGQFLAQEQGDADLRESASVAHIYGQNLVAAESMTALGVAGAAYTFAPETLKATADRELADGVNRFVIHTSAHQPLSAPGPGVTLGPFGQWFTRHETWAEQASPWVTYLSRSSYLLQQGHFAADILYYYGQDSNITALYAEHLPAIPVGYAFDFANAHSLTKLSVRDGILETANGMRYRVLALDPRARLMSLDVLKEIARLVKAGATVAGRKPEATPSLADSVTEFHALADAVWGRSTREEHRYGMGHVLAETSLTTGITKLGLLPDFSYVKPEPDAKLWFVHRRLEDGDLYFVNNRQNRPEQIEVRFRVTGMAPELWHADTGLIEPASYRIEESQTVVPLTLDSQDAVFVVFRKRANQLERHVASRVRQTLATIAGPWTVTFQSGCGAPRNAILSELKSWTANADAGIRYFSGTASYRANFEVSEEWLKGQQRLEVDLGTVKNLAELIVNGQSAGIVWKPPFRADLTAVLRPGVNSLEVRVTNLWPNRLIGDKQPGSQAVASTTFNPYSAESALLESGLLGPVTLLRMTQ